MSEQFFEKMTMPQLLAVARSVGFSGKDRDGKLLDRDVLIDSLLQFEGAGMFEGMRRPNAKGGKVSKVYYNGQGKSR
tara:strand:+ start:15 stop:245 length:231 start_codon:yes stop_codon:yes gene_type:complete